MVKFTNLGRFVNFLWNLFVGMIKVENQRPTHSVETVIGHEGIKQTPIYYSFPSRFKTAYKLELEHFLDVVQGKIFLLNVLTTLYQYLRHVSE